MACVAGGDSIMWRTRLISCIMSALVCFSNDNALTPCRVKCFSDSGMVF